MNQRGLFGDLPGVLAVFVPNSLGGMTGGALSSAAGGGRFGTGSGRGGKWAVGHFGNQAEVVPPALLSLSIFFLFLFLISFDFCLETFAKPSDLIRAKILQFVNLSLCY
jgi:hypothetical protein